MPIVMHKPPIAHSLYHWYFYALLVFFMDEHPIHIIPIVFLSHV
ncbi:hypothetical protein, partial [Staphylococcus aureus]